MPEPLVSRFWKRVRVTDGCWEWIGRRNPLGYGTIYRVFPQRVLAHRLSWEIHHGPIPDGQHVCHRCDNPPCVRPDHLFLGTQADNIADMIAKGRQQRGERNGRYTHPEAFPIGSQCSRAKLTEDDVRNIRRRYATGDIQQRALAIEYGVHKVTISEIVLRKKWKHVL